MSNAQLQLRIDKALKAEDVIIEAKKMFGGVAFMVNDHMSVGITKKGDLMVRVDPQRIEEVLEWPGGGSIFSSFHHTGRLHHNGMVSYDRSSFSNMICPITYYQRLQIHYRILVAYA